MDRSGESLANPDELFLDSIESSVR